MIQAKFFPSLLELTQWHWIGLFMFLAWGFLGLMAWAGTRFIQDIWRLTQRMHRTSYANSRCLTIISKEPCGIQRLHQSNRFGQSSSLSGLGV